MTQITATAGRTQDLVRWGSVATVAAGLLSIAEVLTPFEGRAGSVLFLLVLVFLMVGLVGFHVHQRHAYGKPTLLAMYAILAGAAAQAANAVGNIAGTDALQPLDDIGSMLLLVGFAVYGGSTLRGRVLPRWCGAAFLTGFIGWVALSITLGDVGSMLGGIWFGALWVLLGLALWRSHREREQPAPSPVSI